MRLALLEGFGFMLLGLHGWLGDLFSAEGFVTRWHCGDWHPVHVYFDVGADLVMAFSYLGIPASILLFASRTRDAIPRENRWIPLAFANFIFWCGMTHLNGPLPYWWPAYRYFTLVKVIAALSSIPTMVALVPTVRHAARVALHARANHENRIRLMAQARAHAEQTAARNRLLEERIAELEEKADRGSDEMPVLHEIRVLKNMLEEIKRS